MTKMTKTVAVAVSIILAAGTASIAASAADSGLTLAPTFEPTVAASESASPNSEPSLSPLNGDATIEDVESNGPPKGGKISTDDPDLEEGYVDPNTPILPTVTLSGTMDGTTFKGTVRVNATDANVETTRLVICMSGSLLLANGNTRLVQDCDQFELTNLGIAAGENQTIGVTIDASTFIARWDTPGVELAGSTIDGMSRTLTFKAHPSYDDPTYGESGFDGNSINLTF